MGNFEDVVRRRKEKDPLMKGGKFRHVDESKIGRPVRCAKQGCQSLNAEMKDGWCTCFNCGHVWKRRLKK